MSVNRRAESPVEVAGEVALDAAADFLVGLALGSAALDVGAGRRVVAHPVDGDDVQGAVELAVAEPVEAVPVGAARRHRDGGGAREHGEGGFAADPPGVGPGQQDLRGAERTDAGLGGDQPGGHVLDDLADLGLELIGRHGEGRDPLAEADQRLVGHPGQPVSTSRAGQGGAGPRSSLGGQVPELFAQLGGSGHDDRAQHSASSLSGLDGVVPVTHQQPQRLPVSVGAQLTRLRAGQQLPGRADRVDRVALAGPPLADVPGGADLGDLLARAGQVPGQAQPVMTGALDRPRQPLPGARLAGPGQQIGVTSRRGGHLPLRQDPAPRIADRGTMGVPMGVHADHQAGVLGNAQLVSSAGEMLKSRHRPGGKLPRQSCDGSRPAAGQAPDQANEGGQAGARQRRGQVIRKTRRQAVRISESHPAPPGTNHGRSQPSRPIPTRQDSQDQCPGHDIPPAVAGDLTSQQGHDLEAGLKALGRHSAHLLAAQLTILALLSKRGGIAPH